MLTSLFIIINIILLEIILSIDNAAVLATMAHNLPKEQQKKALTYGIFGAYIFRGLALLSASILINVLWLKVVGGLYLIYLAAKSLFFIEESKGQKKLQKLPFLNEFWSTVVLIELMDLIFSIDNVFGAVAFTSNIWLICFGVFVGIIGIRFATGKFMNLLNQVPVLEKVAYSVIMLLGIRLVSSYWFPDLTSEVVDLIFSIVTLVAFVAPVVYQMKIKNKKLDI